MKDKYADLAEDDDRFYNDDKLCLAGYLDAVDNGYFPIVTEELKMFHCPACGYRKNGFCGGIETI